MRSDRSKPKSDQERFRNSLSASVNKRTTTTTSQMTDHDVRNKIFAFFPFFFLFLKSEKNNKIFPCCCYIFQNYLRLLWFVKHAPPITTKHRSFKESRTKQILLCDSTFKGIPHSELKVQEPLNFKAKKKAGNI